MAEDIEDTLLSYRLKTIEIIEEKMVCSPIPPDQIKEFHFSINIRHKIKKEDKVIIVIVEVEVKSSDENVTYGSIKTANIFEIKSLDPFMNKNTGAIKFPVSFETNLNSISVSTIRGIMFSHFKGTYLHQAILPVIHPSSFKLIKTSA